MSVNKRRYHTDALYRKKILEKQKEYGKKYKHTPEAKEVRKKWDRKYAKKRRNIVLEFYGGRPPKCAYCEESTREFLAIAEFSELIMHVEAETQIVAPPTENWDLAPLTNSGEIKYENILDTTEE